MSPRPTALNWLSETSTMLMMMADGRATDWDEVPLILGPDDLAALLDVKPRTLRRWAQLGDIPAAVNRTWSRDEIIAWILAGRPSREIWERIRPQHISKQ